MLIFLFPYLIIKNDFMNRIKNFSFLLSPKTWFGLIVFPGSLTVVIGAASPRFRIRFAGSFPRCRRRRKPFGLL
jgi:hypothetical protein